ncbi:MAG TPA: host attachment protein [Kofleriaceae bacterium]|nr:host attachment protein [Kofleriaceae bacterium]
MYRTCIVVADAARARLFTFERTAEAEGLAEELIERRDLVNPARRLRSSKLFSDSRPGVSRMGKLQYAFDDHRDAHIDAFDAEFSRMIVGEVAAMMRATHAKRLILCASPHMLGALRDASSGVGGDITIDEMPRNLVKLSPSRLRDQLAEYRLLPERPARQQV